VSLPLGISFYTFQSMSYTIDVYKNKVAATRNIIVFMTYVTMFPQLVAGPIVRFAEIECQLRQNSVNFRMFSEGLQRFLIGFIKKVLIANPLGEIADRIFDIDPSMHSTHIAWLGLVVYSFQIYFDFSGYSCMAIGLGRMFGFNFPENFNYPYLSRSLTEFWRRWHMTLSNWFRDYLYIPLGGSRVSGLVTAKNLLIVFILCGLWHGAKWNFIIWGLYHGLFLGLERLGLKKSFEKYPAVFGHIYFITVLLISWVFFRIADISKSILFLKTMFIPKFSGVITLPELFNHYTAIIIVSAIVFSMPVLRIFIDRKNKLSGFHSPAIEFLFMSTLTILTFISIMHLVAATYNPFIYFRF
jgi:alginate O-acetyltransferase complex protein AlgI